MRGLLYLSAGITCLLLLFLIGYILYRGLPNLNWTFLTSQESVLRGTDGIMPAIQNTLYVIVVTLIFILPLGVGGRHLPHRVRLQPQAGLCHRVRHRDSGRHPLYPVRPGGYADLLSGHGPGQDPAGRRPHPGHHDPAHHHPHHPGVPEDGAPELPGGLPGPGGRQVAHDPHRGAPSSVDGIVTGCILSIGRVVGESAVLMFTAGMGTTLQNFSELQRPSSVAFFCPPVTFPFCSAA